MLVIVTDYGTN